MDFHVRGEQKKSRSRRTTLKNSSPPRAAAQRAGSHALSFCLRDSALRPCTFGTRFHGILQSSSAPGLLSDSESFHGYALFCALTIAQLPKQCKGFLYKNTKAPAALRTASDARTAGPARAPARRADPPCGDSPRRGSGPRRAHAAPRGSTARDRACGDSRGRWRRY